MNLKEKIKLAKKIRDFEYDMQELYNQGSVKGSIHLAIGQELHAVDIISQLKENDIVISNHRNHAHYLALTRDFDGLRDELQGLPTGMNQGKCLSQHIFVKGKFYANGIQGGMCPIACGMAMGLKLSGSDGIVVNFIGDGTLGQGVVYESLNIASLWKLPIVFILENNQYAMSTSKFDAAAGSFNDRFNSFGLLHAPLRDIRSITPAFTIIDTYRFCGHSAKNEDYRPKEEIEDWKKRDILEASKEQ